jgi:hypothetical protein
MGMDSLKHELLHKVKENALQILGNQVVSVPPGRARDQTDK